MEKERRAKKEEEFEVEEGGRRQPLYRAETTELGNAVVRDLRVEGEVMASCDINAIIPLTLPAVSEAHGGGPQCRAVSRQISQQPTQTALAVPGLSCPHITNGSALARASSFYSIYGLLQSRRIAC